MAWFRVYDTMVDDPKVQQLPPRIFKALINLWCLASQNDGALPNIDAIAFALRLPKKQVSATLLILQRAGLIDNTNNSMCPHNWDGRQFKSDTSSERMKRHRRRHSDRHSDRHSAVTGDGRVTPPDTDTESETERASTSSEKLICSSTADAVAEKRDLKQAAPYAFEGHIVRLRQNDYERWRRTYPKIINFDAELQRIDDWHQSHPEQSDGWFYRTSNWLKRSNDEAETKRKEELRRQGRAW